MLRHEERFVCRRWMCLFVCVHLRVFLYVQCVLLLCKIWSYLCVCVCVWCYVYAFTCVCAYPVDPLSIHTSKHRTQTQTLTQRHTQHLRNTQTNNTYKSFTKQADKENRHNTAFAKKKQRHTQSPNKIHAKQTPSTPLFPPEKTQAAKRPLRPNQQVLFHLKRQFLL